MAKVARWVLGVSVMMVRGGDREGACLPSQLPGNG
jgi:hypothetical protein